MLRSNGIDPRYWKYLDVKNVIEVEKQKDSLDLSGEKKEVLKKV